MEELKTDQSIYLSSRDSSLVPRPLDLSELHQSGVEKSQFDISKSFAMEEIPAKVARRFTLMPLCSRCARKEDAGPRRSVIELAQKRSTVDSAMLELLEKENEELIGQRRTMQERVAKIGEEANAGAEVGDVCTEERYETG